MTSVLTEMIGILVAGITQLAGGIGSGLTALVQNIFLTGEAGSYQLSTFGGVVCVFAGISLAIGLCRMVVTWVQSLGN